MINTQAVEPFDGDSGVELDFHSMFYTIQGEGPHAGRPAIFLRLAGCNLQCPWCDTEYSKGRRKINVRYIVRAIDDLLEQHPYTRLIVITGGEPTRQNLDELIDLLTEKALIQIESNGVLSPSTHILNLISAGSVDYVVSPKTHRIAAETVFATCFKYVLSSDSIDINDGLPIQALGHKVKYKVARPPQAFSGEIYLSPMDADNGEKNYLNLLACRDSALKYGYRLGLQLHKLINVP